MTEPIKFTEEYSDFEKNELQEKIAIVNGKYLMDEKSITKIFLGVMHLEQLQNLKGKQIILLILKQRYFIEQGIKVYLDDLVRKGEVEELELQQENISK